MTIRVLLAEDHAIVREGFRVLIEKQPDMELVGEAANGAEAIQIACSIQPDIVVMDIAMPIMNGIEATRRIKERLSDTKILALSAHDKPEYVMDIIKAGAAGYLLKDCVAQELIQAIRAVAGGESYLSPKIAKIVMEESTVPSRKKTPLNKHDIQTLKLLANGKSAAEIAANYGVNVKTVEAQRRRIMKKLQIDNLADLVKYAIRQGFSSY